MFPVVPKHLYNKNHKLSQQEKKRRTCSIVLGISRPGGMGVSSQQRQLLLQCEWSLETPFRGPWKRQKFLLCLVKIVPCLFMTNIHKVLWRPSRREELPLFQTKFKILVNFQCLLSVKFLRHSKGSGTI